MYLVYLVNYVRRSRKPVRRLPFGRDTTGDMQFFLHVDLPKFIDNSRKILKWQNQFLQLPNFMLYLIEP